MKIIMEIAKRRQQEASQTDPGVSQAVLPRCKAGASPHHPQEGQQDQGFNQLQASDMVSPPPTKDPTCSRERSSGQDHGPATEITPTTDHAGTRSTEATKAVMQLSEKD